MKTPKVSEGINFELNDQDKPLVNQIVKRAMRLAKKFKEDYRQIDCEMDITACHLNGNPLDLQKLLAAPNLDFTHDMFGIRHEIDRRTGKLSPLFSPRCSLGKVVAK